ALTHHLPAMTLFPGFARDGGLMAYGPDLDRFRQVARLVVKILHGAKPADLPIERPTEFKLVINLKTAQELGLTIPPTLLFHAEEVIGWAGAPGRLCRLHGDAGTVGFSSHCSEGCSPLFPP